MFFPDFFFPILFVLLTLGLGVVLVRGLFSSRPNKDQEVAYRLGFKDGFHQQELQQFESSGIELAYLEGVTDGSRESRLLSDRQKLKGLTQK